MDEAFAVRGHDGVTRSRAGNVGAPIDPMHLYFLNRGVRITPFHNMVLISPDTSAADVERHNELFTAAVDELAGSSP